MNASFVWLNGDLREESQATVLANSRGVMVGDGLFETMLWDRGRVIGLHRHWLRLQRSAQLLDLPLIDENEMRRALEMVANAHAGKLRRLRFTLARRDADSVDVIASASALNPWPKEEKLTISPWCKNERSPISGIKSTSYQENIRALADAKKAGFGEALLANTCGQLCEGTASNVFVVLNGKLVTPSLSSGCLPGVTRQLALESEVPIIECDISMLDLASAEEILITSSTRHIQPVGLLDGKKLPGASGKWTKLLMEAYLHQLECE